MPGIRVSGPLFTASDAIMQELADQLLGDLLARGEELVKEDLYPGHGVVTGQYRRGVLGERRPGRVRHGVIHDSNAVQGPWLEGTSSRNKTTRFKGYAMFRRATQQLEREKGKIGKDRIRQAVNKLNG